MSRTGRDSDGDVLRRLIRGEWLDVSFNPAQLQFFNNKKELKIFVSSTFTDTHLERDILMEKILPRLEREANRYDISVTIVDMRYGVRDENTKDHKGWLYCKHELERCFHQSSGVFFLSLQGDKYGSRPLPRSIHRQVMDERLLHWEALIHQAEREGAPDDPSVAKVRTYISLFQSWYQLDMNAIPPEYILRDLHSVQDNYFWQTVVPTLREALIGLPCDQNCPDISIGQSITEWETRFALYLQRVHQYAQIGTMGANEATSNNCQRFLWIHRYFEAGISVADDITGILTDRHVDSEVHEPLQKLHDLLKSNLGEHENEINFDESNMTRNRRPVLLRCPSSFEYLRVIQRRQAQTTVARSINSFSSSLAISVGASSSNFASRQVSFGIDDPLNRFSNLDKVLSSDITSRQLSFGEGEQFAVFETPVVLQSYLLEWENVTSRILSNEIARISREANTNSSVSNWVHEIVHHCKWALEKVRTFVGRQSLQEEIFRKLDSYSVSENTSNRVKSVDDQTSPSKQMQNSIHLALIGVSGCGKTALMARLAQRLYIAEKRNPAATCRPIIVRFCGTSSSSTNPLNLLQSIIFQIMLAYSIDVKSLPKEFSCLEDRDGDVCCSEGSYHQEDLYENAVCQLHYILLTYPVVLLLDSLDQLSNDFEARSRLSFLQGLNRVHPRTRVIVSTLPDDEPNATNILRSAHYYYQCETRLREWNIPCISVPEFERDSSSNEAEYLMILRHILTNQYHRTVSPSQWSYIAHQAKQEPTALYLQMACRLISTWTSFPSRSSSALFTELASGVTHIIHQVFDTLEYTYGKALTRVALGYITAMKTGVRDSEICDLISLHEGAMKEVFQYVLVKSNSIDSTYEAFQQENENLFRVPYHVWARLRQALQGLIVEKEDGALRWYHRQLLEVAESRYTLNPLTLSWTSGDLANQAWNVESLAFARQLHSCLARYFANIINENIRQTRLISRQNLLLLGRGSEDNQTGQNISVSSIWNLCQELSRDSQISQEYKFNLRKMKELSFHVSRAIIFQLRSLMELDNANLNEDRTNVEWLSASEMVKLILSTTSLEYVCILASIDRHGNLLVQLLQDYDLLLEGFEYFRRFLLDHDDVTEPLTRSEIYKIQSAFLRPCLDLVMDNEAISFHEVVGNNKLFEWKVHANSIATRLQDYSSWLRANLSLILHDPVQQIVYTASRYTAHSCSVVFQDVMQLRKLQQAGEGIDLGTNVSVGSSSKSPRSEFLCSDSSKHIISSDSLEGSAKDPGALFHAMPPSISIPPATPTASLAASAAATPLTDASWRTNSAKQSTGRSRKGSRMSKHVTVQERENARRPWRYYQILGALYGLDSPLTWKAASAASKPCGCFLSPFTARMFTRPPTYVGHKNVVRHIFSLCREEECGTLASTTVLSHCWSEIRLWNTQSGLCTMLLQPAVSLLSNQPKSSKGRAEISCVAVAPDSTCVFVVLAFSSSNSSKAPLVGGSVIQVWSLTTGQCVSTRRLTIPLGSIALSASANNMAQPEHNVIMCCAMNGAGTILATAAVDRSVCLWQLSSPITASWNLLKVFSLAHRQDIHSLAFAPRIRCREILSSTSADKTVKLWSVFLHDTELVRGTVHPRRVHGGCQAILSGHKAAVAAFAFQNILVKSAIEPTLCEDSPALSDATEFPEDAPSVEETSSMDESSSDEHTEEFSHTFASDETIRQDGDVLLSSAAGSMIKIWLYKGFDRCEIRLPAKPELLPCIATLSGHQGSIAALQFSAVSATDHKHDAARFLFSCGREDQSIRIWQVASFPFTCLYQWTAHKAFVTDMCIAGLNDHLMTSSLDKSLKVWDLRIILNQLAASSSDPGTGVPFQRELSTTATTTATMMTTTNGAHHAMGTSLSSSSSSSSESHGQQFGVADDEHRSTITCITVSPDGRFMLSASLDQQLRLWNLSTHNLLRVFDHPHQEEEAGGANESTNATIPIISILHFCYCSDWEEANYRSTSISLDEVYFVSAIWQNNGRFKLWNGAQHHRCLRVIQAFVPLSSQTVESPTGLGWSVPSSIRDIAMDFNDGHLWTVSYDGRIKFWAVDALITASESTYIPSSASNSGDADVFCGMVLDSSAASDGAKLADGKGMKRKVGKQESGGASSSTSFPSEADTEGCLGEIMDYYVGGSSTGHLVSAVAFADGDNDEDDDDDDDDDAAATNSPSECFESPPTSPGFHADVSTARCGGRHRRRRRRRRRPSLLAIAQESGCIHLVHTGTKKCVRRLTTRCHSKNPSTETWHDFPPPPATAIASSPSDVVVVETPGPVMNAGQRKASSSAATATATRPVSVDVPFVTTGNMNNLRDIHPANHHHQGHQHVSSVHVFTRPNEPNVTVVASGMMHQSDYSGGGGGDGGGGGIPIGSVIWIWYDVDVTSSSSSSSSSLLSLSLSTSSSVSEPPSQTRKARRKEKQQQQRQQRGSSRKVGGGHDRHYDVIVAPHRVFHWQRFLQQLRRSPSAPSERAADRWSGVRLEKKDILRQVRVLSREAWSVAAITSGGEVFVVDVGALPTRRDVEQQAAATAATAAAVQESYYAVIRTRFTLYDDWVTCIVGNVPDGKIAGMMAGGTTSSVLVGTRNGAILTTES